MILQDFMVFTAPYESEDEKKVCYVAIETYEDQIKAAEFADELQDTTPLQVNSIAYVKNFFYTYGKMYKAAVLEVQLKEEMEDIDIPCEIMAVSATYMYLRRKQVEIEASKKS